MSTADPRTGLTTHDPAVEPLRPEASLGDLFSELTTEVSDLVRKELELAKVEVKEDVQRARDAAVMGGIAGVSALLALILLSLALAWWLDEVMHPALAHGLVGLLWLIAAAVFALSMRQKLKDMRGLPQTTTTLKEDVQWIKAQRS